MKQWNLTYNKTIKESFQYHLLTWIFRILSSVTDGNLEVWKFHSSLCFLEWLGLIYSSNKWPKFGQYVIEIMWIQKNLFSSVQTLPLAMVLGQCRLMSPPCCSMHLVWSRQQELLEFSVFPNKLREEIGESGSQDSRSTSNYLS